MWFLAWREIRHSRVRFGLLATLVALVAYLVFVMTGLAVGLGEASVSGLRHLPADQLVFANNVQRSLDRSDLPADLGGRLTAAGARSATPVGFSMANLAAGDDVVSVGLLGWPTTGPMTGSTPGGGGHQASKAAPGWDGTGLLLDRSAADKGLKLGQTVRVQPGGVELTVTGFADLGTYSHTPMAYVPLSTWQQIRRTPDRVSAYLVEGHVGAVPGTEAVDKETAITSVPSYVAETGTVGLIRSFLYAGAALLIGTVFWILTLQKEGSLAVLRATGARRGLLLGSYLMEVLATLGAGVAVSGALAFGSAALLPAGVFLLTVGDTLTAAGLLTVLALAGSLVSMRRLLTVDPLLSLGRSA
ncbi:ABC transporter permease [Longispora fulva]|uniref:Putative ABC transport system permease protein n=1 Tax=Longispora fulva TaxID=619741 RepID=A0A8J7GNR8_9ACTN|nr:FtsX-like permease family protein [Longispora fulva]MBG6140557.1 putative ABC transport system permease protein [Longispora fulva]GIG57061.1 ABC transporter permease [Longispora fulva]